MFESLISIYSLAKAGWSRVNDLIKAGEPRRPVPLFHSPQEAATYLMGHCVYVPDPLGGAADWNVSPERLQAAMESGPDAVRKIPGVDCDDWAMWAVAACRQISGCTVSLYTLADAGVVGTHVICAGIYQGTPFAIDTNGLRLLPDLMSTTICRVWTGIYASRGYRYIEAVPIVSPF